MTKHVLFVFCEFAREEGASKRASNDSSDGGHSQNSEGCSFPRLRARLCCSSEALWKGQSVSLLFILYKID